MSATTTVQRPVLRRISRQTGLVAAFLFILANSVFALLMLREVRHANNLVAHTQDVLVALQEVRELIRQAGAGQRAYLFTGDRQYLLSYEQAEQDLPPCLDKLGVLVSDNMGQVGRVATLTAQVADDHELLANGLLQAGLGNYSKTADLMGSRARSESLARAVDPILDEERSTLQAHISDVDYRNTWTLALVSLGTVISLLAVAVMLYRLRGEAHARNTELAGVDAALRESEQRFRRIFEESPVGVVLADRASQRIVQANPAFSGMLGYAPEELLGTPLAEITHISDLNLLREADQQTARPGDLIEVRYLTRSGAVTWARVRVAALTDQDRHGALLLCLVENISQQKQIEAELRQAQKMEAIGHLTGGIAHDFNNLLGVIIGNAEFLMDVLRARAEYTELANEILNSALSGADLTRRLLAFARRQTLQPHLIDLNAYLPNHIAILRRLLSESIQVTTRLAAELWPIRADPSQVGDALLNLAINARDAMPHGGNLTILTANAHLDAEQRDAGMEPGDYVVLSVTDTGIGMSAELLERAMEPFFTTKGPGAGSGLGLSMIYGFAKQSGGHLRINSQLGQGTVVRLYFPRAQATEPAQLPVEAAPLLPSGNEAILVVDDNPAMRTVARRHLASLGYRVGEAESGPAALAILDNDSSFDLLFTDFVMPDGMTGHQLAAIAQQRQPGLKVLFTTGYARAAAGSEPAGLPASATIRKPYRKHELAATVRATLEA
jgi:PAS domain S-box-containing protein